MKHRLFNRAFAALLSVMLVIGLMPVTALAAGFQTLYVGNTQITTTGYWTSSNGGTTWTQPQTTPSDNYIYYDGDNGTLKLHNVSISGNSGPGEAGIYAYNASDAVSLNIEVTGSNEVSGFYGVFAYSEAEKVSVTITGTGSLTATGAGGGDYSGIFLRSNTAAAELTITGVDVTAENEDPYGQCIQLRTSESSAATLAVNGGSLTTIGPKGIHYQPGAGWEGSGKPSLIVSNNAVVRANGGISHNSTADITIGADSSGNNGGIVFDGTEGTVYGDVTLQEDLVIGEGESLTIGDGASLTVPEGTTLTNNGTVTVAEGGTFNNQGSLACNHHIGGTATCTEKAKCSLCGAEYGDIGPHSLTKTEAKEPTCTEEGNTEYWTCRVCGKLFEDENGQTPTTSEATVVPATGHQYGEPVWSWAEDGKTCTVTFTCENDETHKESPKVTVTSAVKTPATCTETGVTIYTAAVEFNGQSYKNTKDVTDIPATGHSYENGKCTVCGAITSDFKAVITAGANGSWQKGTKDGLSFTSNAAYKHFQKVQVDGKDLDASNYTVKEGSTIVTLKASYLETLSVGKHTLAVVSETGTATTEFTVKAAAVTDNTRSPQTGDNSNVLLWAVLLLLSGGALCTTLLLIKRKSAKNR